MKSIAKRVAYFKAATHPRTPRAVAEAAYRTWSYVGRHRYVEPEPALPPEPVWRTLKLGWQAHVTPIPVVEVFR